jgi:hypothetical protein
MTPLAKLFEDRYQALGWNTRTGVFHRNFQLAIDGFGEDAHLAALGSKLNGVAQKIP